MQILTRDVNNKLICGPQTVPQHHSQGAVCAHTVCHVGLLLHGRSGTKASERSVAATLSSGSRLRLLHSGLCWPSTRAQGISGQLQLAL